MSTGIEERHGQDCPARNGGRCAKRGCGFRASVWDKRTQRRIRKTFATAVAARSWRSDAQRDIRTGQLSGAATAKTLRDYADEWLAAAETGQARNRSGQPYKPTTLRGYRTSLKLHVYPTLGAKRLADLGRADLQRLVTRLQGKMAGSTVHGAIVPLQAVYRHAVAHGDVPADPTTGLQLPASNGVRPEPEIGPADVVKLLDALPERDRALWATAFYAGLRLGELQALRWSDIDLDASKLRVERTYDPGSKTFGPPKTAKGRRTVPIFAPLAQRLRAHGPGTGLAFGDNGKPFGKEGTSRRAERVWEKAQLPVVGFQDARHVAASMMLAAIPNLKVVSAYIGHASISITVDRYGHLLPDADADATQRMDKLLMGQSTGQS